jgi:hypothetical protein
VVGAQGAVINAKSFGQRIVMYRQITQISATGDQPQEDAQFVAAIAELATNPPDSLVRSLS